MVPVTMSNKYRDVTINQALSIHGRVRELLVLISIADSVHISPLAKQLLQHQQREVDICCEEILAAAEDVKI